MNHKKMLSLLTRYKKYIFVTFLIIPVIVLAVFAGTALYNIARASFGSWGDNSLVHACKDARGRVTIVGSGDSCNQNETQVTWLKDVNAGDGLTVTRSSDGATLSLTDTAADGWTAANETWTYASSQSFTVSGDQTGKYTKGTKLKWTQTSTKYGVVIASSYSSPNTTVTIATNTDYTIANAAISNNYYSYQVNPEGYPQWFNYAPLWESYGTQPSIGNGTLEGRFSVVGSVVHFELKVVMGSTTTYGTNAYRISLPIAASSSLLGGVAIGRFYDVSAAATQLGYLEIVTGSGYGELKIYSGGTYGNATNTAPWTWAQSDQILLNGTYGL